MTDMDREIWREAFALYDGNLDMPDSEDAWIYFVRKTAAYASAHPGSHLARALALALIDAVEGEAKERINEPVQTSFLEGV